MQLRIPYEVVKEAVDKAANPKEPGTAIVFCVWTLDGQELKVAIERPKEWAEHPVCMVGGHNPPCIRVGNHWVKQTNP